MPTLVNYQDYKKEDLPWAVYEACCDAFGCTPYPEAEAYYKRRGRLKPSPEEPAE